MSASERIEKLCAMSIVRYTFIHEFLMMMDKVESKKVPTAGVRVTGTKFVLEYNPNFLDTLTDQEAFYLISHEIYHLVLHHCTRTKYDYPEIGNIACDLAVNELIPEDKGILEKPHSLDGKLMGIFVEEFEKEPKFKGIEHKQTSEWYYDFVAPKLPKVKIVMRGQGKGEKGDKNQGGEGDGKDKAEQSGGGKSDPNETIIEVFDDHSGWDKDNEIADEMVRAKVEEISRSNKWGNTPSEVVEAIMAAQKAKVNWKRHIRRWGGNLAWKEREQTVKRPNRRTGFIHPGHKRVHVDKVLLAVDTSGSVESEALAQFLAEMNRIHDIIPMDVCMFDAGIAEKPKPFNKKVKSFDFKGRGGTDFEPVMELVKERKYKGVIILTDGCAPAPTRPNARVLWALIEAGNEPPVPWGDRVWIKKH